MNGKFRLPVIGTGVWRVWRFSTLALILLWLLPVSAAPPPPEPPYESRIVEWTAPPPDVRFLPGGAVELVAAGYEIDERPGALRLPITSTLIAIPPGATPSLRILSTETASLPLPGPIAIAPRPEGVQQGSEGFPIGPAFAFAAPLPAPAAPVVLEEVGVMRGVRLARIVFYPAIPEGDHLRVYRRIRVEVTWEGASLETAALPASDPLLEAIRRAVLNPRDATPASTPIAGSMLRPQGGPREAFLEVSRTGLYRVTYQDLQSLGFAGENPANFRLFRGEDEVAYEWEGDNDSVFEAGEAVLFYAEPRFSRWTNVDVYRLEVGQNPGLRMTARSADPSGLPAGTPWVERTFEENRIYMPASLTAGLPPGRDGDRWVWADLKRPGSPVFSTSFPLTGGTNSAATLMLWMIGYTSVATHPDHRVDVAVNGIPLGRVEWDGKTAVTATFPISPNVLAPTNTLQLSLPGIPGVGVEGAWLDAFTLRFAGGSASWGESVAFATSNLPREASPPPPFPYRLYLPLIVRGTGASSMRAYTVRLNPSTGYRAYDITDSLRPVRLLSLRVEGQQVTLADPGDQPRRYIVATEEAVRAPDRIRPREDLWGFHAAGGATGADYLIITHPAFADTLGSLVNLRQSQGLTVAIANVLGVYDAYGDGRPDPEAIRRFIADAYATWNPRPTYVLLVGDGSYDPKRYRPESPLTFIPPYLADVDPQAGETAADNRYVCVDGNDNLPDLLLGRLPVKTADEARAVVGKIVDYEKNPLPGGWNALVLLVADDPDWAGNFPALSDAASAWVTAPFTITRRYCLGTDPNNDDCDTEAPALRGALLGNWNQGAFLIQYFGHASWQQWARERVFHLDDLPSLHNSRRYPVVTEMTCFTGAFHRPEPTLDEALVTRPEAGAVAAWGPTGLSLATGHSRLANGFFRAVFSDTVGTVGEAVLAQTTSKRRRLEFRRPDVVDEVEQHRPHVDRQNLPLN
ncbi:MAG: C25 family cysteine peptidase, partial [Anaerolineae bacterium]|nr:C25 family cysteine peptidase [Anaerolineae bacterium]